MVRALMYLSISLFFLLRSPGFGEIVYYVSPQGSDANPGSVQQPFATLEKARDMVRSEQARQAGDQPVTVYLRAGTYTLNRPLELGPQDSGTEKAPVIYRPFDNEKVEISGGLVIEKWKTKKINKRQLWVAELPEVKSGQWTFHQMWVNGERRTMARHPNQGYAAVARVPERPSNSQWSDGDSQFGYRAGDVPATDLTGADVVVFNRWVESRLPIERMDKATTTFHFSKRSVFRLDKDDPYFVENSMALLDEPGEWYLDRKKGQLFYCPLPGETTSTCRVVIPRLKQLLLFKGVPDSNRLVSHIYWQHVAFSHTEWYFPPEFKSEWPHPSAGFVVGGFPQAAVSVPACIEGNGCRAIRIENCTIAHVGTYGIHWMAGCRDNNVIHCEIADLGAGGIKIGEQKIREAAWQTANNTVLDCHIHDGGKLFASAIGIWIGQSYDNELIHNHIHDFYYSGLSIGWTWGYGDALARGNLVELNHVHHIGVLSNGDGPVLSDMAAIYTLGTQPGTIIRTNLFHDVAGLRYGGWGIYFDEGSTHILAEKNIVYRTTHGGFHQHYGKENVVRNNIFAFARDFQIQRSRKEPHTSYSFEKNIVYWDKGKLLQGGWDDFHFFFDRNVYWQTEQKPFRFDTLSFDAWRQHGMDRNSVIADPLFVDPAHDDFRLKPESPAFDLGFEPIPIYKVTQPWEQVAKDSLAAEIKPRLLYNQDATNVYVVHDTVTVATIDKTVDEAADAGVTTFLICPNMGQAMAYKSSVTDVYHFKKWPARPNKADSMKKHISDQFQGLLKAGLDPTELFLRRARLRGMEAFVTFRMNELHDVDLPSSPLLADFWSSHPEYRVGGYAGWGASALNYAVPAVRQYFLQLLREVCERFSLDGLDLDFMRFPYYFPDHEKRRPEYTSTMTEFVAQVRAMTKEVGQKRGKKLLLSVRVPSTLAACAFVGLDVAEWSKQNLVDFITVSPFLSTEVDMPVYEFKAVCGERPVYAAVEYTLGARNMTPENLRAAAASLYDMGADGIYMFNYFCAREENMEPDFGALMDVLKPENLAGKNKWYGMGPTKYPIKDVSMNGIMPLTLTPGQPRAVTLRTPEQGTPRQVVLRLEAEQKLNPEQIFVEFNEVNLDQVARPAEPFPFNGKINQAPPPNDRVLEFVVPPNLLQNSNQMLLVVEKKCVVNYIYIAVRY